MTSGREVVVTLKSTGCKGQDNEVNFLEHVILSIDMSYSRRGDLQILLTSPAGAPRLYLLTHTQWRLSVENIGEGSESTGWDGRGCRRVARSHFGHLEILPRKIFENVCSKSCILERFT